MVHAPFNDAEGTNRRDNDLSVMNFFKARNRWLKGAWLPLLVVAPAGFKNGTPATYKLRLVSYFGVNDWKLVSSVIGCVAGLC